MKTGRAVVAMLLGVGLAAGPYEAAQGPKGQPVPVYLTLKDGTKVAGTLAGHDEENVIVSTAAGPRSLAWSQVQPVSVYLLKRRLVDLTQAESHWKLGVDLLAGGERKMAIKEFALAAEKDPGYKDRCEKALANPERYVRSAGGAGVRPALPPVATAKYKAATAAQVAAAREAAEARAEKTRTTITASLHLVETEHFLIYSAWKRASDQGLKNTCEGMYRALCKQFDIPADQNLWVGKCPVYVFWEREHYRRFAMEVDRVALSSPSLLSAAGYHNADGAGLCYIVMIAHDSVKSFSATLVHEGSHAFAGRYLTHRHLPAWLNEGLAEIMAAQVVPGCRQTTHYLQATREALRRKLDIRYIFSGWRGEYFDYGLAQSIVRYLIARDRQAFIKLIRLLKEGRSEAQALAEAYQLTQDQLVEAWGRAAQR